VGARRRRHQKRSRKLLAGIITSAVVIGLAGVGFGAFAGYSAVKGNADRLQANLTANVQGGQQELEAGKASLEQANSKHDPALADQAIAHFTAAQEQFRLAAETADGSTLLRYLEQAPAVGTDVRAKHLAVDFIADIGSQLSDAGIELANLDKKLIAPAPAGPAGRTLLSVLKDTSTSLAAVRASLLQAQADAARIDLRQLSGGQQTTVRKVKDTIDSALTGIDQFQNLAPVLNEVLGGNGTRTYLVEQLNPAELRAGGGFIGSYTILRANQGAISVLRSGDAYDLANPRPLPGQKGFLPQPTPLREIIPDTSWSFVDSNVYPDFPSNAKAALKFVEPRIGKLDGVIAFDYYTVAKMLSITGPLKVPGYGITVTSSNLIQELIKIDIAGSNYHKTILSAMAGPLMKRVSSLSADKWPSLLSSFNGLATQRHLQVYLKNESAEKEIDRYGWSGALNPTNASEFFMELEDNFWGNKVNYYLTRHFTISLTRTGNVLHHQINVDFVNQTPANSYPRVDYKSVLRLYASAPISSAKTTVAPPKFAAPAPPSGFRMLSGWLDVACCGGRQGGGFSYDTPWTSNAAGDATLYWQKQPGTAADSVDVVWSNGGHTFRVHGVFAQDIALALTPTAVILKPRSPGQAALPSLNLG
jgi:uncharacterized protein DUF4012